MTVDSVERTVLPMNSSNDSALTPTPSLFPKSKAQLNREKYAAQEAAAKVAKAAQRKARRESLRPAWGSQEWAETRGDDRGLSADY